VLGNGAVMCWGYNHYGQLGIGTSTSSLVPVALLGIADVIAVEANSYHTCALSRTGSIDCWGYNAYGALGIGSTTDMHSPILVAELNQCSPNDACVGQMKLCQMPSGKAECVDQTANLYNCGYCGHTCDVQSQVCYHGTCVCGGPVCGFGECCPAPRQCMAGVCSP
jgi:alpha-tubulin suppressor-like RCC1 family protein